MASLRHVVNGCAINFTNLQVMLFYPKATLIFFLLSLLLFGFSVLHKRIRNFCNYYSHNLLLLLAKNPFGACFRFYMGEVH